LTENPAVGIIQILFPIREDLTKELLFQRLAEDSGTEGGWEIRR
jgi:hypothetical protein